MIHSPEDVIIDCPFLDNQVRTKVVASSIEVEDHGLPHSQHCCLHKHALYVGPGIDTPLRSHTTSQVYRNMVTYLNGPRSRS